VTASLEVMLGQLKQWDDYRRFHREVAQLLRDQEDLARGSAEVGRRTLTRELKDLPPQEVADLKVLAGRQLELARRLDRIEQDMDEASGDLRASDPLAADTVSDAVAESRRLGIGAAMRSAGTQLQENRMGQAAAGHKQIAQNLQEVLDILANRRQNELVRLVRRLQEAEGDLKSLQQQQGQLREELAKNAAELDPARRKAGLERLTRRQEDLCEQTERMARRLERLQAEPPARTLQEAADRMKRAGQALQQENHDDAAKRANEAEQKLEEAQKQLAKTRLEKQAELAMEQLAKLEDALKHIQKQEQNVLDETRRFAGLAAAGQLTRAQAASLRDLARLQQSLQSDTARLGEQMKETGGFHLALSGAQSDMGRAAGLLERRETGSATQQAEQSALSRLAMVLEALKPETPAKQGDGAGPGPKPGGPQGQPGGVQTLAELKLLKLMQDALNQRTLDLHKEVADREPTEAQKRQYAEISAEQGRLADLAMRMISTRQNPEDREGPVVPENGPEKRRPSMPEEEMP
jgi:myosin heavy subunit